MRSAHTDLQLYAHNRYRCNHETGVLCDIEYPSETHFKSSREVSSTLTCYQLFSHLDIETALLCTQFQSD